ncbi:hypothetical protein [Streptomyces fagopyri]|uniref:hypothetical protein n=1 Tax=Streptomyces fagopyri TaxID=2662397 RepID=UPI0038189F1D
MIDSLTPTGAGPTASPVAWAVWDPSKALRAWATATACCSAIVLDACPLSTTRVAAEPVV